MSIGKQAKILSDKQQNLTLAHLETTRYPLRNKIIFLLSFKEGLRAKEISKLVLTYYQLDLWISSWSCEK